MAPEVLSRNYREKCDLWSAGVSLYLMLTGKLPFSETRAQTQKTELTFPSDKQLSTEAISLIKALLNPKPEERYSASQALNHPWFATNLVPSPKSKFDFGRLTNYLKLDKTQKLIMAYIAAHTPDTELLEQMKEFVGINTSRTGVLSKEEVYKWISEKNLSESKEELFEGIDINKTKGLEYLGTC